MQYNTVMAGLVIKPLISILELYQAAYKTTTIGQTDYHECDMKFKLVRHTKMGQFSGELIDPIVMREFNFEENPEYHEDGKSDGRALKIVKRISKCFQGKLFLLVAAQKFHRPGSGEWVLSDVFRKSLRLKELDYREIEVEIGAVRPLSVAVVDLADFAFEEPEPLLFNQARTMLIFSEYDLNSLAQRACRWILNYEVSRMTTFDYQAIANDLKSSDRLAFFRYFASDNQYFEAMTVVGPVEYVDLQVVPSIQKACNDQSVKLYTTDFVDRY